MNYQLVLQWPASSIEDYDSMVRLEEALIDTLTDGSEVDGHDGGSGEMNIFIRTNTPKETFRQLQGTLASLGLLTGARAAYRQIGKTHYEVLWPSGLREFTVA